MADRNAVFPYSSYILEGSSLNAIVTKSSTAGAVVQGWNEVHGISLLVEVPEYLPQDVVPVDHMDGLLRPTELWNKPHSRWVCCSMFIAHIKISVTVAFVLIWNLPVPQQRVLPAFIFSMLWMLILLKIIVQAYFSVVLAFSVLDYLPFVHWMNGGCVHPFSHSLVSPTLMHSFVGTIVISSSACLSVEDEINDPVGGSF